MENSEELYDAVKSEMKNNWYYERRAVNRRKQNPFKTNLKYDEESWRNLTQRLKSSVTCEL